MLTPVQTIVSAVGRFPTSGSCGQLLVYVMVSFGRLVDAAHATAGNMARTLAPAGAAACTFLNTTLEGHGIAPAPERGTKTPWKTLLANRSQRRDGRSGTSA